jgi:hypothetical protein
MRITPLDENKVNNGTWVDYMGVPLLIARGNNETFRREFRRLSKPYQRKIDNGEIDETVAEQIMAKSLAKGVLLGWDENKIPGGTPYSQEAAVELILDDPDCRDFIIEFSGEIDNFLTDQEDYDKGK